MNAEWLEILKQVKMGLLSVEEAAQRLEALDQHPAEVLPPSTMAASAAPPVEEPLPDMGWWGSAWMIPFWVGTAVFVLGALLMGWAYSSQRSFWFACSWLPFLLGLLVLFLGWWSRNARWVHVRIQPDDGPRISISMPLPLKLAGWLLRVFGRFIPPIQEQKLDFLPDIFDAIGETKDPVTVDIDDGGDKVKVYIL